MNKRVNDGEPFFTKQTIKEYILFSIGAIVTAYLYGQFMTYVGMFPIQ